MERSTRCLMPIESSDTAQRQRISYLTRVCTRAVFMSDGGEDVRQVQEYLHPNSEHLIDWFHITMRLTVL
jgi:hypothetical protein